MRPLVLCLLLLAVAPPPSWSAPVARRLSTPPLPTFFQPFDFAPAPNGAVFVLEDLERRVLHAGSGERARPLPGLRKPQALALDPDGLLHVIDAVAPGQLELRTYRGERPLRETPLQGDVVPENPVAAAARDGIVWVLERSPPRLFLYAYDGASLGWVDMQDIARAPFDVALGAAGEAFVTDPMGPSVLSFSPTGEFLGQIDLADTGVTRPTGVTTDRSGRVWVSDGVVGHVVALDAAGQHVKLNVRGRLLRLQSPLRLAWQAGNLWVLESGPGRLLVVELE